MTVMNHDQFQGSQIPSKTVRSQVARVLASSAFVNVRRMQRFLRFIVEETLANRADQIGSTALVSQFSTGEHTSNLLSIRSFGMTPAGCG